VTDFFPSHFPNLLYAPLSLQSNTYATCSPGKTGSAMARAQSSPVTSTYCWRMCGAISPLSWIPSRLS